jgi:organic hydroperoxide reductase OsmC/OhrA
MSSFYAEVLWERHQATFLDNRYSRGHHWKFDGGATIPASSSPHVVPVPYSIPEYIDPEEAFVAALSSCHMLFFLSLAAKAGFVVDSYADKAKGSMSAVEGVMQVKTVTLNPRVSYSGTLPSTAKEAELHHRAHGLCFIANSVKTKIEIKLLG